MNGPIWETQRARIEALQAALLHIVKLADLPGYDLRDMQMAAIASEALGN